MRVALFTETFTPDVNGVVAHVQTLRDGLEKLGHEVLVVTADKRAKKHYVEDGVLRCPAAEAKKFYGFGVALPYSRARMKMILDFDPDVIHIHHEFGVGLSGIYTAKRRRKPLVYTLHTMYDQYIYYIVPKAFLRMATKASHRYERFIARSATALTGPSEKCREYFKEIGVDKELNLIPNSADLDAFDPEKLRPEQVAAVRSQYKIPPDRMIACFVGRLAKEKSVDVLLDYWTETIGEDDKLHLMIIGDGPDKKMLEQRAETLGIGGQVTFTGLIPHDRMPAYFTACDVYVTASLSEMNSISMLEGMATGLPTLQRYDELNADQIQAGVNGYLYHTPEEFGQKLRELRALSPAELKTVKQGVIDSVRSRGSVELAEYMLGVYEKAIEQKMQALRVYPV